jgi:hypothetical protein
MASRKLREHSANRAAGLGLIGVIAIFAVAAAIAFYYFHKPRHRVVYDAMPVANSSSSPNSPRKAEFETLFASDTPLSSFARHGEYTVVEVYLDVCAYCREFEAGFAPFNAQRADVSFVRIHHPGHMNVHFKGHNAADMQRQAEDYKARMQSYGFCGTPHVEVYGPDRSLIAKDTCGSRAGTVFMWDWITNETGIKPKRSATGITGA